MESSGTFKFRHAESQEKHIKFLSDENTETVRKDYLLENSLLEDNLRKDKSPEQSSGLNDLKKEKNRKSPLDINTLSICIREVEAICNDSALSHNSVFSRVAEKGRRLCVILKSAVFNPFAEEDVPIETLYNALELANELLHEASEYRNTHSGVHFTKAGRDRKHQSRILTGAALRISEILEENYVENRKQSQSYSSINDWLDAYEADDESVAKIERIKRRYFVEKELLEKILGDVTGGMESDGYREKVKKIENSFGMACLMNEQLREELGRFPENRRTVQLRSEKGSGKIDLNDILAKLESDYINLLRQKLTFSDNAGLPHGEGTTFRDLSLNDSLMQPVSEESMGSMHGAMSNVEVLNDKKEGKVYYKSEAVLEKNVNNMILEKFKKYAASKIESKYYVTDHEGETDDELDVQLREFLTNLKTGEYDRDLKLIADVAYAVQNTRPYKNMGDVGIYHDILSCLRDWEEEEYDNFLNTLILINRDYSRLRVVTTGEQKQYILKVFEKLTAVSLNAVVMDFVESVMPARILYNNSRVAGIDVSEHEEINTRNVATWKASEIMGFNSPVVKATNRFRVHGDVKELGVNLQEAKGMNFNKIVSECKKKSKEANGKTVTIRVSPAATIKFMELHFLDAITLQTDRHLNNIYYETSYDEGKKEMVINNITGIDNDISFGLKKNILDNTDDEEGGMGGNFISVFNEDQFLAYRHIARSTYERIVSMTPETFCAGMTGYLDKKYIDAAAARLVKLQRAIALAEKKYDNFVVNDEEWTDETTDEVCEGISKRLNLFKSLNGRRVKDSVNRK